MHVRQVLGRTGGNCRAQFTIPIELSDAAQRFAADRGVSYSKLVEMAVTNFLNFVPSSLAAGHISMAAHMREPGAETAAVLAGSFAGSQSLSEPWHPQNRETWLSFEVTSGLESAGMPRSDAVALAKSIDFSVAPIDTSRHSVEVQRREASERQGAYLISEAVSGVRSKDPDFDVREHFLANGVRTDQLASFCAEVDRIVATGEQPPAPLITGLART